MIHDRTQGGDARPRAVPEGAVLDLTTAQMEAAARLRATRRRAIPLRDVVAVGGRDLRARSVEQPFPPEERAGREGGARLVLLVALLVGMSGGYLYVTRLAPERPVIEVSPPETRQTIISEGPEALRARG